MDAETRLFYIFADYKNKKAEIEDIQGWLCTLGISLPQERCKEFENALEKIKYCTPKEQQYDETVKQIELLEAAIKAEGYSHTCPLCGQGQICKTEYRSGEHSIIIYECDECYTFWEDPYFQSAADAIGHNIEGADKGYMKAHGIEHIDEVIDHGSFY